MTSHARALPTLVRGHSVVEANTGELTTQLVNQLTRLVPASIGSMIGTVVGDTSRRRHAALPVRVSKESPGIIRQNLSAARFAVPVSSPWIPAQILPDDLLTQRHTDLARLHEIRGSADVNLCVFRSSGKTIDRLFREINLSKESQSHSHSSVIKT